jgi:hypothetical protein
LANIEASWKSLPAEEQYEVYQQLEEIQKRDWKELTIDEKKAGKWYWTYCQSRMESASASLRRHGIGEQQVDMISGQKRKRSLE